MYLKKLVGFILCPPLQIPNRKRRNPILNLYDSEPGSRT